MLELDTQNSLPNVYQYVYVCNVYILYQPQNYINNWKKNKLSPIMQTQYPKGGLNAY